MFIIGLESEELSNEEIEFISSNKIGGVILFDRNIVSIKQLTHLISSLKKIDPYIFIAVDNEGGRVQRLKSPLFQNLPPMKQFGSNYSKDIYEEIKKFIFTMSSDLKKVGFNLNFAPCLDVLTNSNNEVIGDRSFGSDPAVVSKLGKAFILEFLNVGIIPCGKHFPGHGDTDIDSHKSLPMVEKSFDDLTKTEFMPFKYVLNSVPMLMTAHVSYKAIDSMPVTLSKKAISLLRSWRYDKIVISDDLDMGALRENWSVVDIAVKAVEAGCDMLLYCGSLDSPKIGLDAIMSNNMTTRLSGEIKKSIDRITFLKKEMLY